MFYETDEALGGSGEEGGEREIIEDGLVDGICVVIADAGAEAVHDEKTKQDSEDAGKTPREEEGF